jgi:hypothetical protein
VLIQSVAADLAHVQADHIMITPTLQSESKKKKKRIGTRGKQVSVTSTKLQSPASRAKEPIPMILDIGGRHPIAAEI